MALHLGLTAFMFGAWASARTSVDLRWMITAGVLARLIVSLVPPFTTHDVSRYLWDGRVLFEGYDPYLLAPDAKALAALRSYWPTPAEHAAYSTLYPPGALVLFCLASSFGLDGAPWAWKFLVTSASLGTLAVMTRLARSRRQESHLVLVALSPLLVLEGGVAGHVDAFCVLAFSAALLALHADRFGWTAVLLGAAVLVKPLPIVVLLPLSIAFPGRVTVLVGGTLGTIAVGYGAAIAFGLHPVGSLPLFFARWRFGSPLFAWLETLLSPALVAPALASLLTLAFGYAAWVAQRGHTMAGVAAALAFPLLASPVVFPWYLMIAVPMLVLVPSAFVVLWTTTLPLTYEVLGDFLRSDVWSPAKWPLIVIATGWCVGLIIDLWYRRAAKTADWNS